VLSSVITRCLTLSPFESLDETVPGRLGGDIYFEMTILRFRPFQYLKQLVGYSYCLAQEVTWGFVRLFPLQSHGSSWTVVTIYLKFTARTEGNIVSRRFEAGISHLQMLCDYNW